MIKLLPHQIDAIKRMKNGCILNGDVGSGKSLTSLGYYYIHNGGSLRSLSTGVYTMMKNPKDLVIITTARKRDTLEWEGELSHFLLSPHPDATPYSNKVIIDSWNNIQKYKKLYGAFFIFDEQRLVGSGAWVKAFLDIARKNKWILLSATPGDTWSDYIPVFVANGFYKNKTQFIREHVIYSRFTKYPKIDRYVNTGKLIRYKYDILVEMNFDRTKLPKEFGAVKEVTRHHEDIWVKFDHMKYREAGKFRWDPYKKEPVKDAAGLCYLWRRITNEDVSRQIAVLELFEDHPKMIIFYNFNYELDILKTIFNGIEGVETGEWNGHQHDPVPTGDSWVYFVQYAAGAEGWNCITTDTIVFFSQNYSYKIMHQAAGRIDRLNTPFTDLYFYYLKSKSAIDLGIARALAEKKDFNNTTFVKRIRRSA